MNTTLYRSTVHPPDTQDQQVLQIPADDALRELALADRLSLRVGVWLLQRAQRPRTERRLSVDLDEAFARRERSRTPAETWALLTYDLQRQLR